MRLLLVDANDSGRWVGGRVGPRVHVLPVALLGLAAHARRSVPGTEVRVVESSLDTPTDADLVGVRSVNFFVEETRRIVRGVRAWRHVPLIVGGPIAAALRTQLFQLIPELELGLVGEGELALARWLRGEPAREIPGMLVRGEASGDQGLIAPPPESLDELARPDYSLIDLGKYARQLSYAYNQRRQGVLVTSRGCPYRCTYCFQLPGTPVRLRSAQNVFEEIAALAEQHEVRDFYVVDDVFNLSRKRALALFDLVAQARLGVRLYFVNGLRVDLCDHEFIDRMLQAGTVWVTFGIETAHPRVAQLIRKQVDLAHARDVISYAQRAEIAVNIDTMFGFPTETPDEARATLDWLAELPRPSLLPYHFGLRGYAGCEIVEQAARAGWDREAFLATGFGSYHELPVGTPSFGRREMLSHLLDYHRRFGLSNAAHLRWSVQTLRGISYTDAEIVDMYAVLMNRPLGSIEQLLALKARGAGCDRPGGE
jgi:tRNA A37 methylthiotransferase MiaB